MHTHTRTHTLPLTTQQPQGKREKEQSSGQLSVDSKMGLFLLGIRSLVLLDIMAVQILYYYYYSSV